MVIRQRAGEVTMRLLCLQRSVMARYMLLPSPAKMPFSACYICSAALSSSQLAIASRCLFLQRECMRARSAPSLAFRRCGIYEWQRAPALARLRRRRSSAMRVPYKALPRASLERCAVRQRSIMMAMLFECREKPPAAQAPCCCCMLFTRCREVPSCRQQIAPATRYAAVSTGR